MFETNRTVASVKHLDDMIDLLEDAPPDNRTDRAEMWFKMLAVIDQNITSVNEHLSWVVVPPPDGTNGMRYPAGVAPEALKDPVARSNYIAAIQVNQERLQKNNLQVALHQLDKRASRSAETFLRSHYTTSANDKSELNELLRKHELSPARKDAIIKMFQLDE